jgi:hypothetical protein
VVKHLLTLATVLFVAGLLFYTQMATLAVQVQRDQTQADLSMKAMQLDAWKFMRSHPAPASAATPPPKAPSGEPLQNL